MTRKLDWNQTPVRVTAGPGYVREKSGAQLLILYLPHGSRSHCLVSGSHKKGSQLLTLHPPFASSCPLRRSRPKTVRFTEKIPKSPGTGQKSIKWEKRQNQFSLLQILIPFAILFFSNRYRYLALIPSHLSQSLSRPKAMTLRYGFSLL